MTIYGDFWTLHSLTKLDTVTTCGLITPIVFVYNVWDAHVCMCTQQWKQFEFQFTAFARNSGVQRNFGRISRGRNSEFWGTRICGKSLTWVFIEFISVALKSALISGVAAFVGCPLSGVPLYYIRKRGELLTSEIISICENRIIYETWDIISKWDFNCRRQHLVRIGWGTFTGQSDITKARIPGHFQMWL